MNSSLLSGLRIVEFSACRTQAAAAKN